MSAQEPATAPQVAVTAADVVAELKAEVVSFAKKAVKFVVKYGSMVAAGFGVAFAKVHLGL